LGRAAWPPGSPETKDSRNGKRYERRDPNGQIVEAYV
jgi:hypothetical protein